MEEKKKTNGLNNIKNLIIAPKRLYKDLKESPSILFPIMILFVLTIINGFLTQKAIISSPEFIGQQLAEATGNSSLIDIYVQGASMVSTNTITIIIGLVVASITIIFTLILRTVFILLMSKLFGGEANFKQVLSVSSYNSIITYFFAILSTLIMVLLNTYINVFSLSAVLMPNGNSFDTTYILISMISIPSIYYFILNVIGLKEINNFEKNFKSIIISVILFIIPVIISVGSSIFTLKIYSMM